MLLCSNLDGKYEKQCLIEIDLRLIWFAEDDGCTVDDFVILKSGAERG